jgi:prevent-host-death family protein
MMMFKTLPELVPISDLRTRQGEILAGLKEGPVILTQHSRAAAVLVSTDQYNRMVEMLEDLQDALDAKEARQNAEPAIGFEEYLAKRGASVSAVTEQSGDKGS